MRGEPHFDRDETLPHRRGPDQIDPAHLDWRKSITAYRRAAP
jgi:hypothetical protein